MKTRSFSCDLQGGLGNQMFQIAAANYVSQKNDIKGFINLEKLQTGHVKRAFAIPEEIFKIISPNVTITYSATPLFIKKVNWRTKSSIPNFFSNFEYRSKLVGYDPELEAYFKFSHLSGYFQTYLYVDQLKWRDLLLDVSFPDTALNVLLNRIKIKNPVAVHIRGGDYLGDKTGIGNLSRKYYENSLLKVAKENEEVWIFSDDEKYAMNLLSDLPYRLKFIDSYRALSPFLTLVLMSKVKRIIISNSTFAWWAAYLSSNSQIYSPTKWFEKMSDPEYLIPVGWNPNPSEWL
jgi:Glycosyl transferase family 11